MIEAEGASALSYGEHQGHRGLRELVCHKYELFEGLKVSPDNLMVASGSGHALETAEALDANPERALVSEELAHDLERAVAKLPLEQRTVFLLKVVEEMRYEEIAKLLGISEGTVMSRLSRARGRLKVMLAAHVAPIAPMTRAGGTF